MTNSSQVYWGKYQSFEGPIFMGSIRYELPKNPDDLDKFLHVITSTEGGKYDAINMYDQCIISVGLIQWCEAKQYSVSNMLGQVADKCGVDAVLKPLNPILLQIGATFKKNAKGQWRFHFNDERGEVNTVEKQQQLFWDCDGKKGSWTPELRARAKLWAACTANIWENQDAQNVQLEFTKKRLVWFITPSAQKVLFDGQPSTGWVGALRGGYFSFAANLPAIADKHLKIAIKNLKSPKWSKEWCTGVLKELTFGPNIAIYPTRYNKIREVLEQTWGVELPKTAELLRQWTEPAVDNVATQQSVMSVENPIMPISNVKLNVDITYSTPLNSAIELNGIKEDLIVNDVLSTIRENRDEVTIEYDDQQHPQQSGQIVVRDEVNSLGIFGYILQFIKFIINLLTKQ